MKSSWILVGLLASLPIASAEAAPRLTASVGPATSISAAMLPVEPAAENSAAFTVADPIQIPGKTLAAGSYTIRIVDHLSDRMIVRVDRQGKAQATFLALPKSALNSQTAQGPIKLNASSKAAMRGFVFPDGTVAEFVYPKAEAVGLAKSNNTTIPAVDPASEGRANTTNLSQSDMQEVTLWMLTPTIVKPGSSAAGIAAAKYKAPAEVASAQIPARPRARSKPLMTALPHTASTMPLIVLLGLVSLCAAALLTRRRLAL